MSTTVTRTDCSDWFAAESVTVTATKVSPIGNNAAVDEARLMLGAASTLSTTDIQSIAPGVHSNPPTAFPSTVALSAMTGAVWSVTDIVACVSARFPAESVTENETVVSPSGRMAGKLLTIELVRSPLTESLAVIRAR